MSTDTIGLDVSKDKLDIHRPGDGELALGTRKGRDAAAFRPGYLKQLCGAHVVFYKRAEPTRLEIVRSLHQAIDMETHLAD